MAGAGSSPPPAINDLTADLLPGRRESSSIHGGDGERGRRRHPWVWPFIRHLLLFDVLTHDADRRSAAERSEIVERPQYALLVGALSYVGSFFL